MTKQLLYAILAIIFAVLFLAEVLVRGVLSPILWIITGNTHFPKEDKDFWTYPISLFTEELLTKIEEEKE